MGFSPSWLLRSLGRKKDKPESSVKEAKEPEEEEESFGVTQQLRDFVKSFTLDTFKNCPLRGDDQEADDSLATTFANVRKDLSEWQERHAVIVLSNVKEISQLRYMLCPRHLKERQFWKIYFTLVKNIIAPFEIRAIQRAKLKRMGMEDKKLLDANACEVEMSEAKQTSVSPHTSSEQDLDSIFFDDGIKDTIADNVTATSGVS